MCRWALYTVIALTALVLSLPQATAAIGFQPVSPDELRMTSEPLAPGAPAIILYREVYRDDDIHIPHEDNYVRIKILTEEGRKHADVEIPFVKESQDVGAIRARTIRPDGSIVEFDGKPFEKYLVKGKFEGREVKVLAKTFTLPDVQVGSIIEYSYTIDFHEYSLFDSHWILSDELFTKKARFSLKPFLGNAFNVFSLRWSWNTLPPGTMAPKEGADHVIRMETANIPAFQAEDYMPPEEELKTRVDFIYEEGIATSDQATYWKQLGKKRNGQLESFVGKKNAMQQAVRAIISDSDSQEVKLRKIYDRVQQFRNTSYELQKTDQELKRDKEKAPDNVEDIWKRGYGDGIQLTWLFLGLVRAAGFEAYGCWVSSRNRYFFSPTTMQGSKLNSNVVLIKLNGKDRYFDPGGMFTPLGLLEWPETSVAGLRLDSDGGTWIQTTLPEATASRIERVGKLRLLPETGGLEGKLTITYTGLEAMYARREELHADDVARKKYLEDLAVSQIAVAAEAELINKPDWKSSEDPLVAEFNLRVPGWASNAGRHAMIPAAIFTAAEKEMFGHANRVQPIYFQYPHEKIDNIAISLPSGWKVSSVPAAQDSDQHLVHYTLKAENNSGTLELTRKLTIDFVILQPKFYPALRNFFQMVRTNDGGQIVVEPGALNASN